MFILAAAYIPPPIEAGAIETLEQAIERTEKNLEAQKKIKKLLVELQELKKKFINNEASKEEAWRMVKRSAEILNLIEEMRLEPLFDLAFLEELKVFASYAKKTSVGLKP